MIICVKGTDSEEDECFSILGGMSTYPDVFDLRESKIISTSFILVAAKYIENFVRSSKSLK